MIPNFQTLIKTEAQAYSEKRVDQRIKGTNQGWLTPMENKMETARKIGTEDSQIQEKVNLKYWSNMISVLMIEQTEVQRHNRPQLRMPQTEKVLAKQLL